MIVNRDVAPGIHLVQHAYVNCYLVEDDTGVTLVDTGLPGHWDRLHTALQRIGRSTADLRAIVLTHAHFDHVGTALRWQREYQVPILAHVEEMYLAANPYRYAHENPRATYPIRHPKALPILMSMARHGALQVKGVRGLQVLRPGQIVDVPGSPEVVLTPGHTHGHCALHFLDRDALITGDALVTLDPYTARTGPRIVAGAATADSEQALQSLQFLAATQAGIVLPGHGDPWTGGVANAVENALAVGAT